MRKVDPMGMGEFDPVQLPFDIEVVLEVPDMAPNSKPDRMRKDEEEEESSLSSVRGSGADSRISGGGGSTGGGGSRRRLPATPQSVRKNTHKPVPGQPLHTFVPLCSPFSA